jgi:hypothetical protein
LEVQKGRLSICIHTPAHQLPVSHPPLRLLVTPGETSKQSGMGLMVTLEKLVKQSGMGLMVTLEKLVKQSGMGLLVTHLES